MRIGWHVDGMTWDRYLALSWWERWVMHEEINDLIERTEPEATPPVRPKRMRK